MRTILLAPVLLLALALGACTSGTPTSQITSTSLVATTTTSSTTTTVAPSIGPPPPGSVPAVANATDLHVAPVIGPGTPPPPTQLMTKDLVIGTGHSASASSTD